MHMPFAVMPLKPVWPNFYCWATMERFHRIGFRFEFAECIRVVRTTSRLESEINIEQFY